MRIFVMECLKMCVVMGMVLTAVPGRPAAAAPSPTNVYVFQQHKRSPADPNLDLTSALTTGFGGFGPSVTLPDFGYGSGFPSTAAGFGFNDATGGFGTSAGLLHLSHPYAATAFGSGFNSIGYPFSESTLSQLQFKPTLTSGSSPSLPVSINHSPSVANAGLHHTHISGLSATELVKSTPQNTVTLQQTKPNEQRVPAESFNAAPAQSQQLYSAALPASQKQTYAIYAPLRQSYTATETVAQQQSYPAAISVPLQQSYPATASAPLQQSYPTSPYVQHQQSYSPSGSVPQQQSYSPSGSVPQQQSYPAAEFIPKQQSYSPSGSVSQQQSYSPSESIPQQQSYSAAEFIPKQQSYSPSGFVPQQQSYSPSGSVPQQQSYSPSGSVPQQQSYSPSGSVPQQQSYSPSGSVPQQQSYSPSGSVPQQQSYSPSGSVPQQQSYSPSGSAPSQQSYSSSGSASSQQSYQAALSAPLQQSYASAASTPPQQSYPATAENFRISAYQPPVASNSASPQIAPEVGSAPDLILELRPPPYTAPASSVDYRQNLNIPSTPSSSYPFADSNKGNNNYPGNNFGLSTAPVAGTSGPNQVSNAPNDSPLPGNTNNFFAISSNAKPDQTPSNIYYTVPLPASGSSNSASSDVSNYFSIPSVSYSLTSTVNNKFAGSTSASVTSIGNDQAVPVVANPTGGPSSSYRDTNSIPSVPYTSSNSIAANLYSDSNSIQSSSPNVNNSYRDYKLSTDNFYGDSNSISPNSKRESSTVNSSEKYPRLN